MYIRYFSLFSGIGGFELGIQQSYDSTKQGIQQRRKEKNISSIEQPQFSTKQFCVGHSEINKYAIQVYQQHFPDHKNYGDATQINPEILPDFDMLTAGFPCQSFSVAGRRKGFQDTRGTLFFEICRIAKGKRPRLLFLENVKGLLSHDEGRTFATIIVSLDELGYDCEWQVLNSKNFGVPQNRERVFIIGHLRGTGGQSVFPLRQSDTGDSCTSRTAQNDGSRIRRNYPHLRVGEGNNKALVAEALQERDYKGGRLIMIPNNREHKTGDYYMSHNQYGGFKEDLRVFNDVSPTIRTPKGGGHLPLVARYPLKYMNRNQRNIEGDYSFTVDGANTGGISIENNIRRLTPVECERLQGFPDNWTDGISDTQRYKCLGNAVTVNVIEAISKELLYLWRENEQDRE